MANFRNSRSVEGLSTTAITVPTTDRYKFEGKISLPSVVNGGGYSSVVVTITQTGLGTIYTGVAGAEGFTIQPFCTAADVITITLSSANNNDLGLNKIKMSLAVSEGI